MCLNLENAHKVCKDLVSGVFKQIKKNQSELEIVKIIFEEQKRIGYRKNWHRPIARIGKNTIYSFDDKSVYKNTTQKDDIVFIDIGLIVNEYEADYAETRVINSISEVSNDVGEYQKISIDSKKIWKKVRDEWKENKLSGNELYNFASKEALKNGWYLDHIEGGHRIGTFPHERPTPELLKDLCKRPMPYEWILEIKLLSLCKTYGAFYEEILR